MSGHVEMGGGKALSHPRTNATLGDNTRSVPGFVFRWEILHIRSIVLTVTFPYGSISCEAHCLLSHGRNEVNVVMVLSPTAYIDNKTLMLNYNKENDKTKTTI